MSLYPDPDKKCPICEHKYFDHYYPSQLERHRCVAWAGRETWVDNDEAGPSRLNLCGCIYYWDCILEEEC